MGMEVCVEIDSLRERIDVLSGRDRSVMSSGGLRRDLRDMVRAVSAPGASFCFFCRGRAALGRIY